MSHHRAFPESLTTEDEPKQHPHQPTFNPWTLTKKKKKKKEVQRHQTANSCMSLTTMATDALFAASATRFISFLSELAGSSGLHDDDDEPAPSPQADAFRGMEPRRLVDVGVGFGTRSADSLTVDEPEDIAWSGGSCFFPFFFFILKRG